MGSGRRQFSDDEDLLADTIERLLAKSHLLNPDASENKRKVYVLNLMKHCIMKRVLATAGPARLPIESKEPTLGATLARWGMDGPSFEDLSQRVVLDHLPALKNPNAETPEDSLLRERHRKRRFSLFDFLHTRLERQLVRLIIHSETGILTHRQLAEILEIKPWRVARTLASIRERLPVALVRALRRGETNLLDIDDNE